MLLHCIYPSQAMPAEAQIGTDLYGSNQSQIPTIIWFVHSHSQHRPFSLKYQESPNAVENTWVHACGLHLSLFSEVI